MIKETTGKGLRRLAGQKERKLVLHQRAGIFSNENTRCCMSSHFEVEQLRRTEQYYSVAYEKFM